MTAAQHFLFLLAVGVALAGYARPATAAPERWARVGAWDISYYPATQGCLAYAAFDGTAFFIGFDTRDTLPALDVTVLDERWRGFEASRQYPVTVTFGDEPPWTLDMQGVHMDGAPGLNILIDARIAQSAQFIEEFQRELRMTWAQGETELGQFTLQGSRRAFEEVLACQRAHGGRLAGDTGTAAFTAADYASSSAAD